MFFCIYNKYEEKISNVLKVQLFIVSLRRRCPDNNGIVYTIMWWRTYLFLLQLIDNADRLLTDGWKWTWSGFTYNINDFTKDYTNISATFHIGKIGVVRILGVLHGQGEADRPESGFRLKRLEPAINDFNLKTAFPGSVSVWVPSNTENGNRSVDFWVKIGTVTVAF